MKRKFLKKVTWCIALLFVAMNLIAAFHAYKFTHFSDEKGIKTQSPSKLSVLEKMQTVFFGVTNPKLSNASRTHSKI